MNSYIIILIIKLFLRRMHKKLLFYFNLIIIEYSQRNKKMDTVSKAVVKSTPIPLNSKYDLESFVVPKFYKVSLRLVYLKTKALKPFA